jgi:hypothetical protein
MRAIARKPRKCPVSRLATAQSGPWAKRFACAIRSTGSSCPGRRALYAAEHHRTRITSRLCNLVHSDRESAMSSPSRFVGSTTASFIARVTRPHGGARSTLILFQSRSGSGSTRGSRATNSPQATASRRRSQQGQRICQLKVHSMETSVRVARRAPLLKTPSKTQAGDFVLDLIDGGPRHNSTSCP